MSNLGVQQSVSAATHERLRSTLVEARKTAGLTQAELAARLARPQSFVSKYERGERRLDVVELLEIASALGFDPAELIANLANSTSATAKARRQ
ncbi:MAG: helix-turn-helix domain-containing protein [Thermoanaerobaculales bacterium]